LLLILPLVAAISQQIHAETPSMASALPDLANHAPLPTPTDAPIATAPDNTKNAGSVDSSTHHDTPHTPDKDVQTERTQVEHIDLAQTQAAAQQGDITAQRLLGIYYLTDRHGGKDQKQAVYWFGRAADQGDAKAQYDLAIILQFDTPETPQDLPRALTLLEKSSAQGYSPAQCELGTKYLEGVLTPRDPAKAKALLLLAAAQGHPNAQAQLGVMTQLGLDIAPSDVEAEQWYLKAAQQGNSFAQTRLGLLYAMTDRTLSPEPNPLHNDEQAAHYFQLAADKGDTTAQYHLALMYLNEQGGLHQTHHEALELLQKAARYGDDRAVKKLADLYYDGKEVPKDLTTSAELYERAAVHGDAQAQSELGKMYLEGLGVTQDDTKTVYWFQKSAEQGNADALSNLGVMYQQGRGGLPKNNKIALQWYLKAAEHGSIIALSNAATIYYYGLGVPKDYIKSRYYMQQAALLGDAESQAQMGLFYQYGQGVKKDNAEAFKWYQMAAAQHNSLAENGLGYFYEKGFGIPQDYAQALIWYQKAADQNEAGAWDGLGDIYAKAEGVPQDIPRAISYYQKAIAGGYHDSIKKLKACQKRLGQQPSVTSSAPTSTAVVNAPQPQTP